MVAPAIRLEVRNVAKRFGGVVALSGVSLEARSGEVHAICGENGAGKSTLMKILAGVITDYEGEVLLNGRPANFTGPRDAERAGVSIIHQELNLVPDLTATANIFLGRERTFGMGLLDNRTMEREAAGYFERLGAQFSPRAKIRDLRIGDQQMVEIAKALSLDADVLIMDEPTSALADAEVERLFNVVESLKREGVTVLYISHKMDEIFKLADKITILRDGKHVATRAASEITPAEVIPLMVGREIATLQIDHQTHAGGAVLAVENLSLQDPLHADRRRLDKVSFELRAGEVLGIAGLLGAGRTELLESLFGASALPPSGTVRVGGEIVHLRSPAEAIDHGIAMVTEDRKRLGLFDQMTVGENITISALKEVSTGLLLRGRRERQIANGSIERLGIKTAGTAAPILSLSGGNQQKCVLARWLLTKPKILLLDEPTRGIDVGAKAEIYVLLRQLCREGLGIVMTSSELPELLAVCDRIMVLCEGRKTAEFSRAQASEESIMHAATSFARGPAR